jgi:hypothetical protein
LDFVGKRYGVLPSELLGRGESIDVWIAHLGVEYENYLHQKVNGKNTLMPQEHNLSDEQLMDMWQKVKQNENKN